MLQRGICHWKVDFLFAGLNLKETRVRADQQLNTVTRGASKGRAIWIDVITDDLHIYVK
jgi:hypothetical protein